jgi:hypothetical protein
MDPTSGAPPSGEFYSLPEVLADEVDASLRSWGMSARLGVEELAGVAGEITRLAGVDDGPELAPSILEARGAWAMERLHREDGAEAVRRATAAWASFERANPKLAAELNDRGMTADLGFVRAFARVGRRG